MTNFARSYSTSLYSSSKLDRRGAVLPKIVGVIVAVALLAGYLAVNFFTSDNKAEIFDPITAKVERGDFVSQVLDQGQLQSSENVEIRCEVRSRNGTITVLNLAPEASAVESGDFLIQLDSTAFEKELEEQRIKMANAKTAVIQAESTLSLIHISEPTRPLYISYAVFCLNHCRLCIGHLYPLLFKLLFKSRRI